MTAPRSRIPPAQPPTAYHASRLRDCVRYWGNGVYTYHQPGRQIRPIVTVGEDGMRSIYRVLQRMKNEEGRVARIELLRTSNWLQGAFLFDQTGALVAHVSRATLSPDDYMGGQLLARLLHVLGISEKITSEVLSTLERVSTYGLVLTRETPSESKDYKVEIVFHSESLQTHWAWWPTEVPWR